MVERQSQEKNAPQAAEIGRDGSTGHRKHFVSTLAALCLSR